MMSVTKKNSIILFLAIVVFIVTPFASVVIGSDTVKIDLNKATIEELSTLKGIGQKYAERIVNYREQNGPFTKIDDILMVKGIGEKTFEKIKDQLIVVEEQ